MYALSPEEMDSIISYINGNNPDFIQSETPKKLFMIARDVRKRMDADMAALQNENRSLKAKLSRFEEKKADLIKSQVSAGEFENLGFDSADIINAIVRCFREESTTGGYISKGRAVLLLYECYCGWLASHRQILTIEAPVATDYGPQFWRAWKHLDLKNVPVDAWSRIASINSGLAVFIRNVIRKYACYNDEQLLEYYKKCTPYMNARNAGCGKNNFPIDLKDIYFWKNPKI